MELRNFRNLNGTNSFDNLKDLNIFIGPNNCGKSNILRAINIIGKIGSDSEIRPTCKCDAIRDILQNKIRESELRYFYRIFYKPEINDEYLTKGRFKISFSFHESFLSEITNRVSNGKYQNLKEITDAITNIIDSQENTPPPPREETIQGHWHKKILPSFTVLALKKTYSYGRAIDLHISIFSLPKIIEIIKEKIVYIPDSRLLLYKEDEISNYVTKKLQRESKRNKLMVVLKNIIDIRINDRTSDFKLVFKEDYESPILDQGSGIRSIICLMCDIISAKENSVILIDEPELGLNPAGKQELLRLLIKKSEKNQIFIATQDPTFLNPHLWKNDEKNEKGNVSVFLYSIPKKKFIKVNLEQNVGDPETFGGYLPHTTSMKNIHLYVEGPSDVYTIQNFLVEWLQREFSGGWHEKFNKIGIFNLGGDCWEHFLYTIPNNPYRSIVILDKDKAKNAEEICGFYNKEREKSTAFPIFRLCDNLSGVDKIFNGNEKCPIYCLKEGEMEDYLDPKPSNKRKDPEVAYKMVKEGKIPAEFGEIFKILTKNL